MTVTYCTATVTMPGCRQDREVSFFFVFSLHTEGNSPVFRNFAIFTI